MSFLFHYLRPFSVLPKYYQTRSTSYSNAIPSRTSSSITLYHYPNIIFENKISKKNSFNTLFQLYEKHYGVIHVTPIQKIIGNLVKSNII